MNRRFLSFVLVSVAGCSGASAQGTVNGTVTLDDQPLKEGVVRFVPVDGNGQTKTANVKDGRFTTALPAGALRVEFSAPMVVGRRPAYNTPESPMVDIVEELLPARYNVQSELRITVKNGSQEETFSLKSK
jgi:hypothetical protein